MCHCVMQQLKVHAVTLLTTELTSKPVKEHTWHTNDTISGLGLWTKKIIAHRVDIETSDI